MAMIFQTYALWPHLTVAQNVGDWLRFKGLRVSAPPARRRQPGDRVRLAVPAEACVPLAADEP